MGLKFSSNLAATPPSLAEQHLANGTQWAPVFCHVLLDVKKAAARICSSKGGKQRISSAGDKAELCQPGPGQGAELSERQKLLVMTQSARAGPSTT